MSADNPYDAPRATVADVEPGVVKRPWQVTIALVILWVLLAMWTMGSLSRLLQTESLSHSLTALYVT